MPISFGLPFPKLIHPIREGFFKWYLYPGSAVKAEKPGAEFSPSGARLLARFDIPPDSIILTNWEPLTGSVSRPIIIFTRDQRT